MNLPSDHTLKVGTINTSYWTGGSNGTPVVLIHGLGEFKENWGKNFDAIAAVHRVYALDLLGSGHTDKPADESYTVADLGRFVMDFLAALKIERATIVGHSLGGAIALNLALNFPAAVEQLVLVSSGGLGKELGLALRAVSLPLVGEMLSRPNRSSMQQSFRAVYADPAVVTPELVEQAFQIASLPGSQAAFLKILRANANFFGQKKSNYEATVSGLGRIQKPTLIIWGRQDQIIPVAHAQIAARGMPGSRLHILEACGHVPMVEQPEVFNSLLLDFLTTG